VSRTGSADSTPSNASTNHPGPDSPTTPSTPTSAPSPSNTVAIAGGVIGGLVALVLAGLAWWFLARYRRKVAAAAASKSGPAPKEGGSSSSSSEGPHEIDGRTVVPVEADTADVKHRPHELGAEARPARELDAAQQPLFMVVAADGRVYHELPADAFGQAGVNGKGGRGGEIGCCCLSKLGFVGMAGSAGWRLLGCIPTMSTASCECMYKQACVWSRFLCLRF
jgi:hypothetical protein